MKILNRKEFLKMPENTIFAKYEPCVFGTLSIKYENCGNHDFFSNTFVDSIDCNDTGEFFNLLDKAEKDSNFSIKMDFNSCGRDGLFEENELYAVWEKEDIEKLIELLNTCK